MRRRLIPAVLLCAVAASVPATAGAAPAERVASSTHNGCTLTASLGKVNVNPSGFPVYVARFRGRFQCGANKQTIHLNVIGYKVTSSGNVIKNSQKKTCTNRALCTAVVQTRAYHGDGGNGLEIKGRYCTAAYIEIGSGRLWNDKVCKTYS